METDLKFLKDCGFKRYWGKYYRLCGDNILQYVGFNRERRLRNPVLYVGFYSLYYHAFTDESFLAPWGFWSDRFGAKSFCPGLSYGEYILSEMQKSEYIDFLQKYALPCLDEMKTQMDLVNSTNNLFNREGITNYSPLYFYAAYLRTHMYDEAYIVLKECMDRNWHNATSTLGEKYLSQEAYDEKIREYKEKYKFYYGMMELIKNKEYETIDKLLQADLEKTKAHLKKKGII